MVESGYLEYVFAVLTYLYLYKERDRERKLGLQQYPDSSPLGSEEFKPQTYYLKGSLNVNIVQVFFFLLSISTFCHPFWYISTRISNIKLKHFHLKQMRSKGSDLLSTI